MNPRCRQPAVAAAGGKARVDIRPFRRVLEEAVQVHPRVEAPPVLAALNGAAAKAQAMCKLGGNADGLVVTHARLKRCPGDVEEQRPRVRLTDPASAKDADLTLRSPPAGPQFRPGSTILIADVLDFQSLPRGTTDVATLQWARVPTEKILDVTMFMSPVPTDQPLCPDLYHPVHHSGPLPFSAEWNLSAHRLPLRSIGGHVVLQNTRSTSADWFIDTPRPGALPPD